MKNIERKIFTMIAGGTAALNGYFGLTNLIGYINNKSVILQNLLSDKPEITENIYKIAEQAAQEIVGPESFYKGLISTTVAGLVAGVTIYSASRKNPK